MPSLESGDLLYEYAVRLTEFTEYGFSFAELMAGQAAPPPEGARFDAWFEGDANGPQLKGRVKGVDYLRLRADGRLDLHIHATLTTEDGANIALFADGVCLPQPGSPVAELRENATLFTSAPEYQWVNPLQVWATGTVDLAEQVVRIRGHVA